MKIYCDNCNSTMSSVFWWEHNEKIGHSPFKMFSWRLWIEYNQRTNSFNLRFFFLLWVYDQAFCASPHHASLSPHKQINALLSEVAQEVERKVVQCTIRIWLQNKFCWISFRRKTLQIKQLRKSAHVLNITLN